MIIITAYVLFVLVKGIIEKQIHHNYYAIFHYCSIKTMLMNDTDVFIMLTQNTEAIQKEKFQEEKRS